MDFSLPSDKPPAHRHCSPPKPTRDPRIDFPIYEEGDLDFGMSEVFNDIAPLSGGIFQVEASSVESSMWSDEDRDGKSEQVSVDGVTGLLLPPSVATLMAEDKPVAPQDKETNNRNRLDGKRRDSLTSTKQGAEVQRKAPKLSPGDSPTSRAPTSTTPATASNKPYRCECEGCGKEFTRKHNLKVHMRRHTGEMPYKCSYKGCGKSFKWKSSMKYHERWHEREHTTEAEATPKFPAPSSTLSKRPPFPYPAAPKLPDASRTATEAVRTATEHPAPAAGRDMIRPVAPGRPVEGIAGEVLDTGATEFECLSPVSNSSTKVDVAAGALETYDLDETLEYILTGAESGNRQFAM